MLLNFYNFVKKLFLCRISNFNNVQYSKLFYCRLLHNKRVVFSILNTFIEGPYKKTFYGRNLQMDIIGKIVFPGRPFQSCLMFASKARSL
jgi:hypothetical protein